jgi:hypothetical protein
VKLTELCTLTFAMPESIRLAGTPSGTRVVIAFHDLVLEGPRLRARQKGPAGDWLNVGAGGVAALDIRFTVETHDGALIHIDAQGRVDGARFAKEGGPMLLAPRFETGDPRYAWLNLVQAVAVGWAKDGAARFELCSVEV